MDEVVDSQNQAPAAPVPAYVVEDIIHIDGEQFFTGLSRYGYRVAHVSTNNRLRELNGRSIDIGQDVIHAGIIATRRQDGHQYRTELAFMRLGNDLIPLGTHANRNGGDRVYTLDESMDEIAQATPLSQYMASRLPEEVTLTRVLSEEEAHKFANGDKNLGSSEPMFWQNAVHTALHNVTNEFEGSEQYAKLVKMIIPRDRLRELMGAGLATVGTYSFALKDRDPLSPFPFDAEVVFDSAAIPDLLDGYARWSQRQGVPYEDSPFYQADLTPVQ